MGLWVWNGLWFLAMVRVQALVRRQEAVWIKNGDTARAVAWAHTWVRVQN